MKRTTTSTTHRWRYILFLLKNSKSTMVGLALFIFLLLLVSLGPYIYSKSPTETNLLDKFHPPSGTYPLGTDEYGRDLLSRIIHGTMYTIYAAVVSISVGLLIGIPLGGIAGYAGKRLDITLMRLADIVLAFPALLLAMVICAALGPSLINSAISVGIAYTPHYMRLIRSKVLSIKEMEFVEAAKSIGVPPWRIFFLHVLPNSFSPVFVAAMVYGGYAILWVTGLSFIGLGAQPPTPELGLMILKGREYILTGQWWVTIFPGVFIAIAIAAFNLIGDGLRDILSPKLRIT